MIDRLLTLGSILELAMRLCVLGKDFTLIQSCKSGRAFRVGFEFGPGSGLKLTKHSGLIRA